jgi:hypothetical protein
VLVGSINAGAKPIYVDVRSLGDVPVAVVLTTDYTMHEISEPPGFPNRPGGTGSAQARYPHVASAGTTLHLLRCEADALIAAGAATLA